jgi:hypothetical protein
MYNQKLYKPERGEWTIKVGAKTLLGDLAQSASKPVAQLANGVWSQLVPGIGAAI